MAGVLLHSGSLQQYTAIGDEGQPVYLLASQLREAVRLKIGSTAAQCLAIPRVNEARSYIDWYSSQDGMVVPWAAATDQERTEALRELDEFHQAMQRTAVTLNGVSDRERRIIQNLLDKVFHFPDRNCVFLVDKRPVLTFWGFQAGAGAPPRDPFHLLRPVAQATVPQPVDTAQRNGRPWWLWLLLLLLLAALLLWLLRGCMPGVSVTLPAEGAAPPPAIEVPAPDKAAGPTPSNPLLTVEPVKDTVLQHWWQRLVGGSSSVVGASTGVERSAAVAADGSAVANLGGPLAAEQSAASGAPDGQEARPESGLPAAAEASLAADSPASTPQGTAPTNGQTPEKPTQLPAQNTTPSGPSIDPVAAALGQPMAIPPSAVQNGSVKFLDGNWRAAGGIQDSVTGQPVRLNYQFDNGKAKVTVSRGNGVVCEGSASSTMASGNLKISEQGTVAKCSDGSTFALPAISCTPDQSGQARCIGVGQDGRSLPITIRKTP